MILYMSELSSAIQHKIDYKTKPTGALGDLEAITKKICLIQNTLNPTLIAPHIVVFAGDHGIANEGVSAYPQNVTWQMVYNFIQGGAAINVFCKQNAVALQVIDCGVNYKFLDNAQIINKKVGMGTKSFLHEPAMTSHECNEALENGRDTVNTIQVDSGCNIIGFGEMGIGNTSSAAMIMHFITSRSMEECAGRGTGLDDEKLKLKIDILKKALISRHFTFQTPESLLENFGGFEIATMVGAMMQAKALNMIIMVDGFIATAAFLVAHLMDASILNNAIFCHQSNESGHKYMLEFLGVKPILNLGMRLGEGTGCAVAYPIIKSAVAFMNEMASFESAGVSNK
jgi:nicotinate-nucleotide--dimethylbenzimidazole phosphoribosyltransferase